ncbi:MAG TPA: peptidylprolyl isomerase, partial [Mycobacterium sp.]|nr:peptidylprolyl isomerase [Mycobacterium sp.]
MPTNEQRRATAKRKLERQLERRAKRAKSRRIVLIAAGSILAAAVIAAVVIAIVNTKHGQKSNTAATTTTSSPATTTPQTESVAPLPPFKPSANLGANCQYPASPDQAAKPVKPPRTGKIPTDPAQVSASMTTSQGNIGLMLANNESPCTVNSFASLVGQGFFNNTKCHRLTTSPTLGVLQCGD